MALNFPDNPNVGDEHTEEGTTWFWSSALAWAIKTGGAGTSAPIGSVLPYTGEVAPTDWRNCDGSTLSRTSFADLFAVVGTKYGNGDGSTTFHLPDMRGQFPRGWSAGSGVDPDAAGRTASGPGGATGDNVGSEQGDTLQNIVGNLGSVYRATVQADFGALFFSAFGGAGVTDGASGTNDNINFDASRNARTSTETRPKNLYFNYIIKVSNSGVDPFVPPIFDGAGTTGFVPDPLTEQGFVLQDDGSWAAAAGLGLNDVSTEETLRLADTSALFGTGNVSEEYHIGMPTPTGDARLSIAAGDGISTGATILLYAATHAFNAFDISLRTNNNTECYFDFSNSEWDFRSNSLTLSGVIHADAGLRSGTTVSNPATGNVVGATLSPDGWFSSNRGAQTAAYFGRTDDGTVVGFYSGGDRQGTISISGTTTSYNEFAGSHYTQLKPGQTELPLGAVVISTGEMVQASPSFIPTYDDVEVPENEAHKNGKNTLKEGYRKDKKTGKYYRIDKTMVPRDVSGVALAEYAPHIDTTDIAGDKRVYGIWNSMLEDSTKGMSFGQDNKAVYLVTQVGLYKIRVTDTNGDIENGDWLETSTRAMEAQLQTSAAKLNSTIGKALMDVDWNVEAVDPILGYKWKLIPVIF